MPRRRRNPYGPPQHEIPPNAPSFRSAKPTECACPTQALHHHPSPALRDVIQSARAPCDRTSRQAVPEVWTPAARPFPARQKPARPVCVGTGRGGSARKKAGSGETRLQLPSRGFASYYYVWEAGEARTAQKHPLFCVWENAIPSPNEAYLETSDMFCRVSSPVSGPTKLVVCLL